MRQRIVVISLLAWLPLLALATAQGQALAGATIPFLLDVEVHARFLVAIPLLIAAELVVHQRMRHVLQQFLERQLIPADAMTRFDAAIEAALRLRNSVRAEVLLIAFVYIVGILVVWRHYLAIDTVTWYAQPSGAGSTLTPAGIWYGYVSLPLFQFLLCRWYFRLFIWARLLWQVSRIKLSLVPTHPDLANSFEVVKTMRIAPVTKEAIIQLAAATLCADRAAGTDHDAARGAARQVVRSTVLMACLTFHERVTIHDYDHPTDHPTLGMAFVRSALRRSGGAACGADAGGRAGERRDLSVSRRRR